MMFQPIGSHIGVLHHVSVLLCAKLVIYFLTRLQKFHFLDLMFVILLMVIPSSLHVNEILSLYGDDIDHILGSQKCGGVPCNCDKKIANCDCLEIMIFESFARS